MMLSFVLIIVAGIVGIWLIVRDPDGTPWGQAQELNPFPHAHATAGDDVPGVEAGPGRTATVYDQEVDQLPFAEAWAWKR